MAPPALIRDFDPSTMLFAPELKYPDGDHGTPLVRVQCPMIQINDDVNDMSLSRWGLNAPPADAKDQKAFTIEPVLTPVAEAKFREIEATLQKTFDEKGRAWFKKDKTMEFVPILKDTDEGVVARIKVVIDGKQVIKTLDGDGNMVDADKDLLNRGCRVLIVGTFKSMWFNEVRGTYGAKFVASRILVKPGTCEIAAEDMFVL